ncbi:MAG: hypothetical protein AAF830_07795 [Pseudomonadota bacterium]
MSDQKAGGTTLALGALLCVAGIIAEFIMGWSTPNRNVDLAQTVAVYREAWSSLRWTWIAQLFGTLLMTASATVLLKAKLDAKRFIPTSVLLAIVVVTGVVVTGAFGTAIGAYPVAWEYFDDAPATFAALVGEASLNYRGIGLVMSLALTTLMIQEGWASDGAVPRIALGLFLAGVSGAVALVLTGTLLAKTAGLVVFAAPIILGLSLRLSAPSD